MGEWGVEVHWHLYILGGLARASSAPAEHADTGDGGTARRPLIIERTGQLLHPLLHPVRVRTLALSTTVGSMALQSVSLGTTAARLDTAARTVMRYR